MLGAEPSILSSALTVRFAQRLQLAQSISLPLGELSNLLEQSSLLHAQRKVAEMKDSFELQLQIRA